MSEEQGNNEIVERLSKELAESEEKLSKTVDGQHRQEESVSERPDWLPEKFKSVEDMAKAYSELEEKLGDEAKDEVKDEAKDEAKDEEQDVDWGEYEKYVTEFQEKGELSEDAYKELIEEKGIPKAIIDDYLALGRQQSEAAMKQAEDQLLEVVGGRAKFNEMAEWARDNLSESEIEGLNASLASDNEKTMKFALAALQDKYKANTKAKPKLLHGESKADVSKGAFGSQAELQEAMNKKDDQGQLLYNTSVTYRNEVIKRLAKSNI